MIATPDLLKQIHTLTPQELAWLSGYCWARIENTPHSDSILTPNAITSTIAPAPVNIPQRRVLILSGSQTGNARRVADQLHQQLQEINLNLRVESIGDYKSRQLAEEDIVLLICSTQGEGEYPEEAISFAKFLFSKRAPRLDHLSFAVLALGDSSYPLFCEAGKNLDQRFAELGATRLMDRIDCDLNFEAQALTWQQDLHQLLKEQVVQSETTQKNGISNGEALQPALATPLYTKDNPYVANLITKQKITARSANKNVQHLEIDLGDSGIQYLPGDSLGIYVKNSTTLVDSFLHLLDLKGDESVQLAPDQPLLLRDALLCHKELTQNTPTLVKKWASLNPDSQLRALIEDDDLLNAYSQQTPLLGLIQDYPFPIDAQTWVDFLRPLTPRMYSIASAQDEVGEEVHLTLGLVQYQYQGQDFMGAASHYLSQQIKENDEVAVFVEPNPRFRLPANPNAPIIMIGAGTGIAPFRAFMQQREVDQSTGSAWLFFGNQKFIDDFLYQSEWQRWHKLGLIHKTSLAWSRQSPHQKIYVQHRLLENAAELWQWLQQGAHLYVCGDANQMAKSVEAALLQIIREQGQLDEDSADEYLNQLRDDQRYQRDVY